MEGELRSARIKVLLASFLTFLLSANIAWLNPSPQFEVYRTGSVPVLWQYNPDAGVELVSAAWFPEAFRNYPERIGRPTYPALVGGLARVVEVVASPIRPVTRLEATGIAYAAFKLATVLISGQLALGVLRRRIGQEAAVLGSILLVLHWHMVEYAAAFHTTDLQLTATVAVLWLAMRVGERAERRAELDPRVRKRLVTQDTFLAGLVVGLLLLAKQTLVAPLAVLAVLVLSGHLLLAVMATVGAGLPFAAYLLFLRIQDITYVSWEVEEYGQGRWFVEALRDPPLLRAELLDALLAFPVDALRFYGPILAFALYGWFRRGAGSVRRWDAWWVTLAAIAAFFQYVGVQRSVPYMTADLGIVLFGAAAVGLVAIRQSLRRHARGRGTVRRLLGERPLIAAAVAASIASAVLNLANFPLVPPAEQPSRDSAVLENRIDMLERPDAYSDEARRLARDGRIVEPDKD